MQDLTQNRSSAAGVGADSILAIACLVVTFAYVGSLPWTLHGNDEGLYFYEAKRILQGDAMYLDFFHFVAPGGWYLLAGCYSVFGASLATAKLSTALVHAVTSACLFTASRGLGVPRALALAAPLAYCALCVPSWPFGSPHWLSTMSTSLLLVVLLRDRWLERSTEQLLAGALVGSVIAVQQHKGLVLVPFVSLVVLMETMLDGGSWRVWIRRLSVSALGTLIVVVPVFGYALYLAGFEPVFQALVLHPLFEYAPSNTTHWGAVFPLARDLAANTYPNVLAWSPLVVPATLGIAVWSRRVGSSPTESRRWLALTAITSASLASALYYPDFVHIAFAAPPAIVSATAIAAWCGRRFMEWAGDRNGARLRLVERVASVLLLGLLSAGAVRAWRATADGFDGQMETKFGRVAVSGDMLPTMLEAIAMAMEESGAEEIYIHNFPQAYLYLDVDNPTPFQIINTANPIEDDLRIAEILEDREIEIVVALGGFLAPRPTLREYLASRYSPVEPSEDDAIVKILRRNAF